jgi:hypothetical protein
VNSGQWTVVFAFAWPSLPMLGWLAAAAAPILIHLWSRQRYREMPWAAMEYLRAALRRQARRIRFEQWLLLAARTLAIVLVVLAVADRDAGHPRAAFTPGSHVHRVLVFDGSYSMAYRPADKTRFDHAKDLARRIVLDSPQGDAFTLVVMSASPRVIVGAAALEPSAVVKEIDDLRLPHAGANLAAAVPVLQRLIEKVGRENPWLGRHEVYFLTDMQRRTWAPTLSDDARDRLLRCSGELAQAASLVVLDLGQPGADNLAITDLRTIDPAVTAGREATFQVRLRQFGRPLPGGQIVELLVDGRRIGQKHAEFSPDGTAVVVFAHRFDAPGDHAVEARALGDALDVDNHRYLVLAARQALRALCIDGCPSGDALGGAAGYLAAALASQGAQNGQAAIEAEVAPESALMERGLSAYDCLFLCDAAQFTASEARAIDAYLHGGGNVIVFLGPHVLADRYHRELGVAGDPGGAGPRILPARLLDVVVDHPPLRLDPLDFRHPILDAFRGRGQAGLLTTPVFKHYRLAMPKDDARPGMPAEQRTQKVLALGDGDPLVVERQVHRGRVVLVATSADAAWTALPLWPSFVPLVHEIVGWCAAGQVRRRNVTVGEPLEGVPAASAGPAAAPVVQSPDQRTQPAPLRAAGDGSVACYTDTWQSGVYTMRFDASGQRSQQFAVNVDTAESDLAAIDAEQLRRETWPDVPFAHQRSWRDATTGAVAADWVRRPHPVHLDLLYAAMGLLLFETLWAWRLGGGRRAEPWRIAE